jgi:hypothetical protein
MTAQVILQNFQQKNEFDEITSIEKFKKSSDTFDEVKNLTNHSILLNQ